MRTIILNNINGYYDVRKYIKQEFSNIISDYMSEYSYYDMGYDRITKKIIKVDTIFMNNFTYSEYFKEVFKKTNLCGVNLYLRERVDNFQIELMFKGKVVEIIRIKDIKKLTFKEFLEYNS